MSKIPSDRVRSHADFDLTPLGMWADCRDAATVMPAAPPVRYRNFLPNPFSPVASMKFEDAVDLLARGGSTTNRREPDDGVLPNAPRNFGSGSTPPANALFRSGISAISRLAKDGL